MQDSTYAELKSRSWSASPSAEAVTSPAGPSTGTLSPNADLIESFQPAEQLQPAAESVSAPTSSAGGQQATAEAQHIAFCCHLYSLLERAQVLCLEQASEQDAAVQTHVSQVTSSTQEAVPRVQGTWVDDSPQHIGGIPSWVEVQDPSAGDSAMVVHGDSSVGSTVLRTSWRQWKMPTGLPGHHCLTGCSLLPCTCWLQGLTGRSRMTSSVPWPSAWRALHRLAGTTSQLSFVMCLIPAATLSSQTSAV